MSTSIDILKYVTLADAGYGQGLTPIGWEILQTSPVSVIGGVHLGSLIYN